MIGDLDREEIEITPAMICAGVEAFVEHDPRFEGLEEAVVRIFQEMIWKLRRST